MGIGARWGAQKWARRLGLSWGLALLFSTPTEVLAEGWPVLDQLDMPRVGGGEKDAAVLIGIEDYAFLPKVPGADLNARAWARFLVEGRGVPYSNVSVQTGNGVRRAQVEGAIRAAAEQVKKGGTLYIVFVGHGAPVQVQGQGAAHLLMANTDPDMESFARTGLPVSSLPALTAPAKAKGAHVVALLDACFTGQAPGGSQLIEGGQFAVLSSVSSLKDITMLMASGQQQTTGPLPGAQRPAFSYLVLGAMLGWGDSNRDKRVTAQEAVDFAGMVMLSANRTERPQMQGDDLRLSASGRQEIPRYREWIAGGQGAAVVSAVQRPAGQDFERLAEEAERRRQEEVHKRQKVEAARMKKIEQGLARAEAQLQREATQNFKKIQQQVRKADSAALPVLEAYLERYSEAVVMVEGQQRGVTIKEVAQVQEAAQRAKAALQEPSQPVRGSAEVGGSSEQAPAGYVLAPAGSFMMGSPQTEAGREADERQHEVTLTQAFWIKATPVTVGEWSALMESRPSEFAQKCGDGCPVERVNWYEALAYANKLSEREGLGLCYELSSCSGTLGHGDEEAQLYRCDDVKFDKTCTGYRLPTEAEWEYAYRAGTTEAYYAEPVDTIAWHKGNSKDKVHPVGQMSPNAWGVYDMAGNVWEWVWDYHGTYPRGASVDPVGPISGSGRALRGGSWQDDSEAAGAAARDYYEPTARFNNYGFRLVRTKR